MFSGWDAPGVMDGLQWGAGEAPLPFKLTHESRGGAHQAKLGGKSSKEGKEQVPRP